MTPPSNSELFADWGTIWQPLGYHGGLCKSYLTTEVYESGLCKSYLTTEVYLTPEPPVEPIYITASPEHLIADISLLRGSHKTRESLAIEDSITAGIALTGGSHKGYFNEATEDSLVSGIALKSGDFTMAILVSAPEEELNVNISLLEGSHATS